MGAENPKYSVVVGSPKIIQLPDKRTWNLTDGVQTLKRFVGTSDAIAAKFNELSATADSGVDDLDEDISGKSGRLMARVIEDSGGEDGGNTEELNAVWELYSHELLKPIESHTDFDTVTVLRKRAIEKATRDGNPISEASTDAEKQLYAYYSVQVLDFLMTELELRKSIIVSNRTTITASYANINEVVTLPSVPLALIGVLTSLPKMDGTTGAWQWLKLCPQIRQVSRIKYQLSYSWRGAERWAGIYPNGTWDPEYA